MGIREPDVQELAAHESLRRLVSTYARAVDRRDFALLRSLYHDDAFEEHGDMFSGGPDAYVAFVERALSNYEATAHYAVTMNFEIDGDRAEGEVYKINYHRTAPPDAHEVITGSRSLDRFRRDRGEWRFLGRSITLDWSTKRRVDAEAYRDFAAGSPPARADAADLSYQVLKLFGRFGN
jgi:SnoaL-like protein